MLVHKYSSPSKPTRVVILGGGGFLSPELARLLAEDAIPTRVIGSREIDLTAADTGDRLAAEIRPDDAVVMAAALTPDKGRDIATLMKNLRMAESVCAALDRAKPAHFLYISSDAVYDARSSLLTEESTCEPADLYSLMHIARERMLEQSCRSAAIPLAIVRPCAIYGPGDTHNSYGPNRFIRNASQGKITLFGVGEEQRDHVYVGDVLKMLKLCLLHRSVGVINAVSGRAASFRKVALHIMSLMPPGVELECRPSNAIVTHRHFDNTALIKSFPGFQPTSMEIGIKDTMDAIAGAQPEPVG